MIPDWIDEEFERIVEHAKSKRCQEYGHLYKITSTACILCGEARPA